MNQTPLLGRVQASNEAWFRKLVTGARFRGVLHPVNPDQLPTSVFVLPRIALRVRLMEPVRSADLIRDSLGRVHLVGDHDVTLSAAYPVSRVHVLFQMNRKVQLKRAVTVIDPVTQEPKTMTHEVIGDIWISLESFTRGDNDAGTRVPIDRLRAITGLPILVGDMLGDRIVKRVLYTLGVYVAEVE